MVFFPKKGDDPRKMSSSSRNIQDIISQSQKVRSDQLASLSVNLATKSTKNESQIYMFQTNNSNTDTAGLLEHFCKTIFKPFNLSWIVHWKTTQKSTPSPKMIGETENAFHKTEAPASPCSDGYFCRDLRP